MTRSNPAISAILAGIAALSLGVPAWVVTHVPALLRPPLRIVDSPRRVVPQAELPPVEPVRLVDLSPDDARTYNAAMPFSTDPNPAARPFRFAGTGDDLARATDCLAAAVVYEAGDDALGEQAVAQVILNRLHHPAFPKTVCAVVFEGAERPTGCQFTFSCDGALTRWQPSATAWDRARAVAAAALAGRVFRPIGYATHYHTDWVVPYWQASLDKIAAVHTHLFFRWSGWWGTPPAFNRSVLSGEPVIAALAGLSAAHRLGNSVAETALAETAAAVGDAPAPVTQDTNSFLVALPRGAIADLYPALAAKACGDRPYCKYSGWTDPRQVPISLPLEPRQIATMTFSYLRDRAGGYDKALWNCQQVNRPARGQCMKVQTFLTAAPVEAAPIATPTATVHGPADLDGVRRRPGPTPTPVVKPPVTPPGTSPAARP